jgi:hypothetical protein
MISEQSSIARRGKLLDTFTWGKGLIRSKN